MKHYYMVVLIVCIGCMSYIHPIHSSPEASSFCDLSQSSHKPQFNNVQNEWVKNIQFCPGIGDIVYDGDKRAKACTFSTLGKAYGNKGYSSHFAPQDESFQSWLGIQIISGKNNTKLNVAGKQLKTLVRSVAQYDYKKWLYAYGFTACNRPGMNTFDFSCAEPDAKEESIVGCEDEECKCLDSADGCAFTTTYQTYADVGNGNPQNFTELMNVPASAWKNSISSYSRDVWAKAFYRVWHDDCGNLIVAYITCTKLTGKDGDKCEGREDKLKEMIQKKNIRLQKMKENGSCKPVVCGKATSMVK